MARRDESRETILNRIRSLPNDDDLEEDGRTFFTEEARLRYQKEPGDTVLKLLNEAGLFLD